MNSRSLQISQDSYSVQLRELPAEGKRRFFEITLGAQVHRAQVIFQDGQTFTLLLNGEVFDVCISANADCQTVAVNGVVFPYSLETPVSDTPTLRSLARSKLHSAAAQKHVGATREIKANMPGKIIKILTKAGEIIQAKQPVLVLEAMKMENEVCAPFGGLVKQVHVHPGESVEKGKILVSLEVS